MKTNKRKTKGICFQVTLEQRKQIAEDAEKLGFSSASEFLRTAWRFARRHPELLKEARQEEIDDLRTRPLSGWHPDVIERNKN